MIIKPNMTIQIKPERIVKRLINSVGQYKNVVGELDLSNYGNNFSPLKRKKCCNKIGITLNGSIDFPHHRFSNNFEINSDNLTTGYLFCHWAVKILEK